MDLNFEKMNGLIPAIIQDNSTSKVLMLGFMNEEAYRKTVETGKVTFFSRTKNRLWTKGEESGNFLNVVSIKEDCDKDTLQRLIYEGADLIYHMIVLLTSKGYRIEDLARELKERHSATWKKH